jgi:hypothetical protein
MADFPPLSTVIGGALIGLAGTLLRLFNGRAAGISGILAACPDVKGSDRHWSVLSSWGSFSRHRRPA